MTGQKDDTFQSTYILENGGWLLTGSNPGETLSIETPCMEAIEEALQTLEPGMEGKYHFTAVDYGRVWRITLTLNGDCCCCRCEPVPDETLFQASDATAGFAGSSRRSYSLLIFRSGWSFLIGSIDPMLRHMLDVEEGSNLSDYMSGKSKRYPGDLPLRVCTNTSLPVQYCDIVRVMERNFFLAISLTPICHVGHPLQILCCLQILTASEFWRNLAVPVANPREVVRYYDLGFGKMVVNSRTVEYVMTGAQMVSPMNDCVRELISGRMVRRALHEQRVVSEDIPVPDDLDVHMFRCTAVPVNAQNRVWLIFSPLEEETREPERINLSKRELLIAQLVVNGEKNDSIARELGVSISMVKKLLTGIYAKLNVGSRAELASRLLNVQDSVTDGNKALRANSRG